MKFIDYGLNKFRNFMVSKSDNGIIKLDKEEMMSFCNEVLNNCECENPGIFIHYLDNRMDACIRVDVYEETKKEYSLDFDDDFYMRYGMLRWNIANPKEYFSDDDYQSEELDPDVFEMEVLSLPETDMEFFQSVDSDYRLCCYAVLVELRNGVWKILSE